MKIERTTRNFSTQAVGSYVANFALLARGLILARLLGPTALGTIAAVNLVTNYAQYGDFGVVHGAARAIPMSLGGRRDREASDWHLYAFGARVITGLVIGAGLAIYAGVRWSSLAAELRLGLLLASGVVLFQGLSTTQQTILRAHELFLRSALLTAGASVLYLALGLAGAFGWGLEGVLASQPLSYFAAFSLGLLLIPLPRLHRPRLSKLRQLVVTGLPITAQLLVMYALVYLDQIIILAYLGRRSLGLYSVVLFTGQALFLLPTALAQAVGPRLLHRYGQSENLGHIAHLTWGPVDLLVRFLPFVVVTVWTIAPPLIVHFLSDFAPIIGPLRIYLVGIFFLSLNLGVTDTLAALNKHRYNLPIVGCAIVLNLGIDIVLVGPLRLGLVGVALGSAVSYTLYWAASMSLVRWFYDRRLFTALLFVLRKGASGLIPLTLTIAAWWTGNLDRPVWAVSILTLAATAAVAWRSRRYVMTPGF